MSIRSIKARLSKLERALAAELDPEWKRAEEIVRIEIGLADRRVEKEWTAVQFQEHLSLEVTPSEVAAAHSLLTRCRPSKGDWQWN